MSGDTGSHGHTEPGDQDPSKFFTEEDTQSRELSDQEERLLEERELLEEDQSEELPEEPDTLSQEEVTTLESTELPS